MSNKCALLIIGESVSRRYQIAQAANGSRQQDYTGILLCALAVAEAIAARADFIEAVISSVFRAFGGSTKVLCYSLVDGGHPGWSRVQTPKVKLDLSLIAAVSNASSVTSKVRICSSSVFKAPMASVPFASLTFVGQDCIFYVFIPERNSVLL
jgi:hypothetical protein